MEKKSKRVLWLLNHVTLLKTEVPILLAMGYEVFIPKIIPNDVGFRSGVVDFSYDKHLTIPDHVLKVLNEADLYTQEWSDEVVGYMNQYFSAAFIMPVPIHLKSGLQRFTGAILLRAFGFESPKTYMGVLTYLHPDAMKWIYAVRDRFWFASSYEQLQEVEPKLIADRDVFLPIALPASFELYKNTWSGTDKHILFVCPNIETDEYYKQVYDDFKRDFGDLPHVIIGSQKTPVNDPNVRGFVSDEQFIELLQKSAAMYYHSHEPRHVHYTPIEGAEIGVPVVLYADNLVARMIGHPIAGAVESTERARQLLVSILEGDQHVIDSVRQDQRILSKLFSEAYCLDVWKQNFAESGLLDFMRNPANSTLVVSSGGSPTYKRVPRRLLLDPLAFIDTQTTMEDGIDFRVNDLPAFVDHVDGLSLIEEWGAWSDGDIVEIELVEPISGRLDVEITAGAYGKNIGARVEVEIGENHHWVAFNTAPWDPTRSIIQCYLNEPINKITIHVPYPEVPGTDNSRKIGIGIQRIAIHQQRYKKGAWWKIFSRREQLSTEVGLPVL
jgi:hypothetical protein